MRRSAGSAAGAAGAAVIAAQRRFRARRLARRRRAVRPLLLLVAVAVTITALGWVALNSSLFAIRTVTVEGTSRLTVAQVLAAARVPRGTSLVRLDPGTVQHRVARLPAVAQVEVRRRWPHGLVISVTERTPAAVVGAGTGVELVDRTGVAFASAPTAPPGLVSLQVSGPVPGTGEADTRAAMQVLGALPAGVRRRVITVAAPTPDEVRLDFRDGSTVVWGSAADSATKVAVLRALLHRRAHFYDVSTPSIAVTR